MAMAGRRQGLDQTRLFGGNGFQRAKGGQMDLIDGGHHADARARQGCQLGNLANAIVGHLQDGDAVLGRQAA
jgi:hypothetical protein